MPRFRNEEAEQAQYTDGDVVWVKIHNTEIWWPGEVTSSQDFRFVNTSRPPFAIVAFFNEKTFEQVKSAKLIYPFQCTHKEEFIKRGTKKADGLHIGDKFSDDVAIAESRYQRQLLGGSHSHPESGSGPAARPDSLIKALLSSSSSNQNSSTRSSSGAPSPLSRQEPTFRIMDIGGTPGQARERRCDEASYECTICSFRTNSMSVLLIHRRAHMDTSSNYSSHSTSTSTNTSVSSFNPSRQTRAARRANTTNALDPRQLTVRSSRDSTHFHKNSVRCHSRHVSIVVDAPLTDEAQQKVASIVKMTMASIERVVHPSDTSSTASNSTRSRSRSNRNSCSLSPKVPASVAPRRSSLNPRDPRSQRANQLRATMPAPQPPAKQRRLTRSMSRRQQAMSPPAKALELPPPMPVSTQRRSGGRRRTLATGVSERSAPPARRGNPMRKTVTAAPAPVHAPTEHPPESSKRQKRTHLRHRASVSLASQAVSSAPPVPPSVGGEEKCGEESSTLPVAVLDPISSLELQLSLLAEWCDDETEDPPEEHPPQQLPTVTNGKKMEKLSREQDRTTEEEQEGEEQASKKRIRNIPKKDRRDMVVQEFDTDGQPETSDEPIVIQDSDASSNESVVFVENEPRQRKKSVNLHPGANPSEKGKSLTLPKQVSANMSSCFDFEEEEELQDGQNGLSYRHCTTRLDGKGQLEPEAPEATNEEFGDGKEAYDELFRGFDEGHQSAASASFESELEEKESSASEKRILEAQETKTTEVVASDANVEVEPEEEAKPEDEADPEADVDAEACDHLSLPIKERQKRIFKSRNKSVLVAAPREENLPAILDREEEDLANGGGPSTLNGEEDHSSRRESNNSHSNANSNTNTTADRNSNASGRVSGSKRHSRSMSGSKRRKKSKTESTRRQPRRSKTKTRLQDIALEELSNNSNTTSSNSNASCHSNPLSTASARSSARSRSHARGAISPGLSSSTSCSIASNIAVISAEEARELQRSASGAGLVHSSIVDATQPVQRGGVLILEDIRLPNLYEPFAGLQSSDSNDSRQQILRSRHEHENRTPDSVEVYLDVDVNADMETEAVAYVGAESDTEVDAETHMYATEDHDTEEVAREHHEQEFMSEADDQIADYAADEDLESESVGQTAPDLDSWPHEEVQYVPKHREVLLKKREQELLRQYEADVASGRSAEKCRRARERWSRAVYPIEEVKSSALESLELEEEEPVELKEAVPVHSGHNIDTMDWDNSLAQELAAVEAALPAMLMSPTRRPASHPGINFHSPDPSFSLATISPSKSSGDLAHVPCDAVFKAHQQLENLCEQRRRRSSETLASALSTPSVPASPLPPATAGGTRRPRRRSRTVTSNEHVETPARSDATEESLCEQKDGSESLENPPQLCAGRICAVMTRPIPGYNHTFMLCSLANNNFTPLNNVALYLDSEKNHLVPVPREALLEPPRLADGHPLSAVFADIDFLGGEAVTQVVDPNDPQADAGLAQSEVRLSPPQIVLSNADELHGEPTETLGIMTPLSQVAEGCTGPVTSFSNEEEELFVDQLPDNMLQLNVNGHRLELDPSVLASIAQQPDTCIELSVVETGPDGSGTMAVLHAQDILEAAEAYLQERDLQLVNLEEPALGQGTVSSESVTASALVVHTPNLLPALLASGEAVVEDSVDDFVDATDAGVGLLHIDTRASGGSGLLDVGDVVEESNGMVFISHALPPQATHSHLTPPITARTNETNALLDQTPIMSTLENPSGVQLRRVSPLLDGNLEDSLAVIGVTHGSGVPTSLELPITVTNPAIAPRMAADIVHFGPFQ